MPLALSADVRVLMLSASFATAGLSPTLSAGAV